MLQIQVVNGSALAIGRPTGILDAEVAMEIVQFVEIHEEKIETGFNRFCDLTGLDGINLSSEDVRELATRRRWFNPNDIHVKSAFLAADALAFGMARMYEQLLDSPRIEVRIWGDVRLAADWLGVNPQRLALP